MLNNKTILVTGGTGSFGRKFISTVLNDFNPKKIIIYSRDELKQFQMQHSEDFKNFQNILRFFIGDVRDLPRLQMALEDVDIVIHAAALKQVPSCEYNPFEAVKTNIIGAQNVIDACRINKVDKVIALSTDKAAAPINLYGATKLASDKLFIAANNYIPNSIFSVVRYGNVMGSRGSVIPFFQQKKEEGLIPITHKDMTRFNITLKKGVEFVLMALENMWGGEIFVPKIPSYKILDVAKAIAPECEIHFIGVRPGEKLHEEMITSTDSLRTIEFDSYYILLPSMPLWDEEKFRVSSNGTPGAFCKEGFSYSSNTNSKFLSIEEIKNLIDNEMNK